ncbi:alpha/beta hydrolase [Isoptericola sp. S6320L]|uniref:alpha/beta hydrolase n=1 Tax=Isoptericola sp. S6320L TaxID=2926411 RepID=UPI001FF3015B|nr:alpha/beta hydrolase [Isoptericola sp. S6320L]MCK0115890.1 alpha/beta hydrolase [Isoptericola sp. S6320L]
MTAHRPHHAPGPSTGGRGSPGRDERRRRPSVVVGILVVVAVTLAVVAAGALLPGVPWVGHVGGYAAAWAPWIVVAGLVVTLGAAATLLRHGTVARVVAVAGGLVAAAAALVVVTQQLRVAQEHAVGVQIAELFRLTPGDVGADLDARYGEVDGEPQDLSLWLPEGGAAEAAPVVVLVHGGGWVSGDRLQRTTASHAAWFAAQGYLAVSIDYPLSSDDRHRWDTVEPQVACALAWVGEHAAEHGGDATELFLAGDSAGGNLALEVAYRTAAGDLEPACDGHLPPVAAVSTLYPVASPVGVHDNPDPVMGPRGRELTERYTGGTPSQHAERYAAITPAEHVTPGAPPTLIVTGEADHLVPPDGSQELAAVLAGQGARQELVLLPAADHVFDTAPGGVGTQVWRDLTLRLFARS